MNLVLLFDDDFTAAQTVCLSGRRALHIIKVHRAQVGTELRVGKLNGPSGRGLVTALEPGKVTLTVNLDQTPPEPLPLTLVLALPRPKMLKRIYRSITELGIKQVYLLNTWRVEKSFWSSPALKPENYTPYLYQGLEQARDTGLPDIHIRPLFKPFVEDELPALVKGKQALVAHPGLSSPAPLDIRQESVLFIGPEGGFIPYEVEQLQRLGAKGLDLGPRILRVENAITYATAKLYSPTT